MDEKIIVYSSQILFCQDQDWVLLHQCIYQATSLTTSVGHPYSTSLVCIKSNELKTSLVSNSPFYGCMLACRAFD